MSCLQGAVALGSVPAIPGDQRGFPLPQGILLILRVAYRVAYERVFCKSSAPNSVGASSIGVFYHPFLIIVLHYYNYRNIFVPIRLSSHAPRPLLDSDGG